MRAALSRKARLTMTCSKCGKETLQYRIVAQRYHRNRGGKLIGVENILVCRECLAKGESTNGTNSKPSGE